MRKKLTISIIASILLICCLIIVCRYATKKMEIRQENKKRIAILEKLNEINLNVNKLISYGTGPLIEERNPTEKEILEYGEGHCGEYSYLFSKYISRLGFHSNVVDIHRYNQLDHSVVEVSVINNKYVFDPTLGLYYKASVNDLINNDKIDISKVRIGEPTAKELNIYEGDSFFKGIETYNEYSDIRDYYEINKMTDISFSSKTNISSELPFEKNEVVNNDQEKILEINFEKEISFYRTKLYFSDMMDDVKKIKISYLDADGQEQVLYDDLVSENSCLFEFTNNDDIEANNIKYTFYMKNDADIPNMEKICVY